MACSQRIYLASEPAVPGGNPSAPLSEGGVHLLLEQEGWRQLEGMAPYSVEAAEAEGRRLRAAGFSPDLVSALLTQQRLRGKAERKLGAQARRMLFTDAGLQQATRAEVSRLHARRFLEAGCRSVADLTVGIGADALALAQEGMRVLVNDVDPVTAAVAAFNLREYPQVEVRVGDAFDVDLSGFDGVFVDPARRGDRGRSFDPERYSPPLSRVLTLAGRAPGLGVKVAPGINYSRLPPAALVEWVSVDGAVVEAGLWIGSLALEGPGRGAAVFRDGHVHRMGWRGDPREPAVQLEPRPAGRYLYEPDGAVIRAGLLDALAAELEAAPVAPQIAYLTGDRLAATPFAQAFQILEVMPYKQVGPYLRERGVTAVEILKRGTDVSPDAFRKSLKLARRGRDPVGAMVVLTRLGNAHRALIVRRLPR